MDKIEKLIMFQEMYGTRAAEYMLLVENYISNKQSNCTHKFHIFDKRLNFCIDCGMKISDN